MKSTGYSFNIPWPTRRTVSCIDGKFCKDVEELRTNFKKYKDDDSIGIIILTERDFNEIKEEVIAKKLSGTLPLVVTIPGPKGIEDKDFILRYIKESVGIKL